MGNFRSDSRGGFGGRSGGSGGFGGRRDGGRSFGGRDRDSGRFGRGERRPLEMHEVICAKCGKETEVPFKPTGDKPVYCRDCFDKNGGDRGRDSGRSFNSGGAGAGAGMSSEQFIQINTKLDKIIAFLETIEVEEEVDEDAEDETDEVEETK